MIPLISYSLAKKRKNFVMAELRRPPVRINLGNKSIKQTLGELKDLGWRPNVEVLSLPVSDLMHLDVSRSTYAGDLTKGKFFHLMGNQKKQIMQTL